MAGHMINPAAKFEDLPIILSWITSYNVSHILPLKMRTAAILFYANYKVKTQNSAWEPGSSHSPCLSYVKKTGSPLLPQNAPWWLLEAFFRNPSRLCVCVWQHNIEYCSTTPTRNINTNQYTARRLIRFKMSLHNACKTEWFSCLAFSSNFSHHTLYNPHKRRRSRWKVSQE